MASLAPALTDQRLRQVRFFCVLILLKNMSENITIFTDFLGKFFKFLILFSAQAAAKSSRRPRFSTTTSPGVKSAGKSVFVTSAHRSQAYRRHSKKKSRRPRFSTTTSPGVKRVIAGKSSLEASKGILCFHFVKRYFREHFHGL